MQEKNILSDTHVLFLDIIFILEFNAWLLIYNVPVGAHRIAPVQRGQHSGQWDLGHSDP